MNDSQVMCIVCAQIEQKKRDKARRAASKEEHIKPLFGEDGKKRTMLDKYDEEEETGMDIDESGTFTSEKAKQQAEIRARLAAGAALTSFPWLRLQHDSAALFLADAQVQVCM